MADLDRNNANPSAKEKGTLQNDFYDHNWDDYNEQNLNNVTAQTQETAVLDKSQVNNYNEENYQAEPDTGKGHVNMNVTDGFQTRDNDTDSFREETAAEIAAPVTWDKRKEREERDHADVREGGGAMGFAALALSILSLFVFPVLFGGAGIILGFIARSRGASSGTWAITIGAISLILGIFILPFF